MAGSSLPIVLYHYPFSPYARRILWYLDLRGIPYNQCIQPPMMPRPDLAELGIKHRRIPVMSIGRDVYLDTRLILAKLESTHPAVPKLGAPDPQAKGLERLLASLTLDTDTFLSGNRLIPAELPLLRDPKFRKDRADFVAEPRGGWASKAEAINRIREAIELLETTLLADGRDWILKTDKPSLADIEAVWLFHWLVTLPQALPEDKVSAALFPRAFAWIGRFDKAVRAAKAARPKAPVLSGAEAARLILASPYHDPEGTVGPDAGAEGVAKGGVVRLWPTDTGSSHRDVGRLLAMDDTEIVIETSRDGSSEGGVRLHAPRHGFRVRADADL